MIMVTRKILTRCVIHSDRTEKLVSSNHFYFAIIAIVQFCICQKMTTCKLYIWTEVRIYFWACDFACVSYRNALLAWFNKIRWIFADRSGVVIGINTVIMQMYDNIQGLSTWKFSVA